MGKPLSHTQDQLTVLEYIADYKGRNVFQWVTANHPRIYMDIMHHGESIFSEGHDRKFSEVLYLWLYDLYHPPECVHCKSEIKRFYGLSKGYATFCSNECTAKYRSYTIKMRPKPYSVKDEGSSVSLALKEIYQSGW